MPTLEGLYKQRKAAYEHHLQQINEFEFVTQVRISAVQDNNTCEFCLAKSGQVFEKSEAPKLPHTEEGGCSCVIGCRCQLLVLIADDF
ncbi:hypothetical protein [Aestuariibius sp. HNIBRBA575]|uniref:hypothetical protein n=1 Tax=Aestuariibius sp. HNIBRBA575 TaxID=3233343 RepID=UPI0034A1F409